MPRDRRGVQPTFVIQQSPPTFRLYQRRRLLIRRRRMPTYLLHVLFLILRKVRGHQDSDFLAGKWYPFMCNDVCLPDVPMWDREPRYEMQVGPLKREPAAECCEVQHRLEVVRGHSTCNSIRPKSKGGQYSQTSPTSHASMSWVPTQTHKLYIYLPPPNRAFLHIIGWPIWFRPTCSFHNAMIHLLFIAM